MLGACLRWDIQKDWICIPFCVFGGLDFLSVKWKLSDVHKNVHLHLMSKGRGLELCVVCFTQSGQRHSKALLMELHGAVSNTVGLFRCLFLECVDRTCQPINGTGWGASQKIFSRSSSYRGHSWSGMVPPFFHAGVSSGIILFAD